MSSATRQAQAASRKVLERLERPVELPTAQSLFGAGRIIGSSGALNAALTDQGADTEERLGLLRRIFDSRVDARALELLIGLIESRWSKPEDLLTGIEEAGIRVAAASAGPDAGLVAELFSFAGAVSQTPELELALGSKLTAPEPKLELVDRLLGDRAQPQTVAIVRHLVAQPRGRRIGELLRYAADVVAAQSGNVVATVSSASALSEGQLDRLRSSLSETYGRGLSFNLVIDPNLIGGLRVQVGDDVIDGSISARISDLRLKLAG